MTELSSRATARLLACSLASLACGACASNSRLVPDQPVRHRRPHRRRSSTATARKRAAAPPRGSDGPVDRLPVAARASKPAPLPGKTMPTEVRTASYNAVKITVLVDTLGRADMRTFKVVTDHPSLAGGEREERPWRSGSSSPPSWPGARCRG